MGRAEGGLTVTDLLHLAFGSAFVLDTDGAAVRGWVGGHGC